MTDTRRIRKGSYGEVEITHDGRAIKRTALFGGRDLVAGNLREASILASFRNIPGVISCNCARILANDILEMQLPEGVPLHHWRHAQHQPKVQELDMCLRDLVIGLYNLHERGILHGDIKPNNVVVTTSQGPRLAIIDIGSACFTACSTSYANDTYIYRAPEALGNPGAPTEPSLTAACDAFSLGATLYYLLHNAHIMAADSNLEQACKWHADGGLQHLEDVKPTQASPMYAAAVRGLLQADPNARTTIPSLYTTNVCNSVIDIVDPTPLLGAQASRFSWLNRPAAVAAIASAIRSSTGNAGSSSSSSSNASSSRSTRLSFALALACDIMDRYAAAVQRPPSEAELLACATAAWGLTCNEVLSDVLLTSSSGANVTKSAVTGGLRAVLGVLQLRLYCDRTAYHLLTKELKHPWVDFEVLAQAIACKVAAADIVKEYLRQRDFVMLLDDSDEEVIVIDA